MGTEYQFLRPYLRNWIFIVLSITIGYFIAIKYLTYTTPIYKSTAKLRLADLNDGVPNSNLFKNLDVFANTQKIQAEIELIKSDEILKRVIHKVSLSSTISRIGKIKNTELFKDSPISIDLISISRSQYNKPFILSVKEDKTFTLQSPEKEIVTGKLGDSIQIGPTHMCVHLNNSLLFLKNDTKWSDEYEVKFLNENMQINEILNNLEVSSVNIDVPVINISYKSSNPEKASNIPNLIAEAYINDYIETKYGAANITEEFLNGRIVDMSKKLSNAELNILNYRVRNGITNITQETETDLRKVSQLKIQQTNLKMNLDAIKDLENYMRVGKGNFLDLAPNFEAFTDLLSTEMIKKIKQLQSEKKDLLLVYTPNNEKVKIIDAKIDDISTYLEESIKNTRKNLQTKYDNLVNDIDQAEKVFLPIPEKERMLNILNREFEIYQQSYNFLNQKKIEAEIAKAAKVAFHRVITPASISKTPVSPNDLIIKVISMLLGMLSAIFVVFVIHRLKAHIDQVSTIEETSMLPIAAAIPKLKSNTEKENFFVRLVSQWQVKDLIKDKHITCFTGFRLDQGLSFVSSQIIQTLKNQGKKILTIEYKSGRGADSFFDFIQENSHNAKMILRSDAMKQYTIENIQNIIIEKSKNYDHTIIVDALLGDNYTVALMAIAQENFVCVDTILTPARKIEEVDLLSNEYHLPAIYFVVNHVGYHPSFFKQLTAYFKKRSSNKIAQTQPV